MDLSGTSATQIRAGYTPGIIARSLDMHIRYYSRLVNFGRIFESDLAQGLAQLGHSLDSPLNQAWAAINQDGNIIGTIFVDGQSNASGCARLRAFIVDDGCRGIGLGRKLLQEAVNFLDARGFKRTELWSFRGLDAARSLYERFGFNLVGEQVGTRWGEEVVEQHFCRDGKSNESSPASRHVEERNARHQA